MKSNEIIAILEHEVKDLMERYDNSKDYDERQEISISVDHTVHLLNKIKGTTSGQEYEYLWAKYNLYK